MISQDTGFDPLIKYLLKQKLHVARQTSIKQIPLLAAKAAATGSFDDKLGTILANLKAKKVAKPGKQKTLASTIQSIFSKSLSEEEVTALIEGLVSRGWITLEQQKVSYSLPT